MEAEDPCGCVLQAALPASTLFLVPNARPTTSLDRNSMSREAYMVYTYSSQECAEDGGAVGKARALTYSEVNRKLGSKLSRWGRERSRYTDVHIFVHCACLVVSQRM
jgi:hypothetical protein